MKFFVILLIGGFIAFKFIPSERSAPKENSLSKNSSTKDDTSKIAKAFSSRQSDLQVRATGKIIKILPDDTKGSKHQRFIVKLSNAQTILIAHNIDLAPRVPSIRLGTDIEFYGEYEWNEKGGVVHWTHHDPNKKHVDGWLRYKGKVYK